MFYALRRHSRMYEEERKEVAERRGYTVNETVSNPEAYAKRRRAAFLSEAKGDDIDDDKTLDEQYEALMASAAGADRDHLGMTRIHNLYMKYRLRFGEECSGLLEERTNEDGEVVWQWNETKKERFAQVLWLTI